jgi:hypothetical protein
MSTHIVRYKHVHLAPELYDPSERVNDEELDRLYDEQLRVAKEMLQHRKVTILKSLSFHFLHLYFWFILVNTFALRFHLERV